MPRPTDLSRHREAVIQDRASRPGHHTGTSGPGTRKAILALIMGWVFLAWIWTTRPEFIFGTAVTQVSAAEREASLRFALYLQRGAIQEYVDTHGGQLPAALDEVGDPGDEITWVRRDGGYVLHATDEDFSLLLTDAMDADSFLGNALTQLGR